ncbi:hypothetical protein D3C84_838010 [compost metagenome]
MQQRLTSRRSSQASHRAYRTINQKLMQVDFFVGLQSPSDNNIRSNRVVTTQRSGKLSIGLCSSIQSHKMRILLVLGNLQAVTPRYLMHIPITRTEVPEPKECALYVLRTNPFKLVSRGLTSLALSNSLRLQKVRDTLGNRNAALVTAISITRHTLIGDSQGRLKKGSVKLFSSL